MTIKTCAWAAAMLLACGAHAQTLTGWALMPAATFADGPTSGQFAAPNPYGTHLPPYLDQQPVQGLSGVLPGPRRHSFLFLVDNGFGAQANSADAVLRAYTLKIDWKTARGGSGSVSPADLASDRPRDAFDARTRLEFNDAQHQVPWAIQADFEHYYNDPAKPEVDAAVRERRLLTGADFDIESIRRDHNGHYWLGDEFGPYLLKTDAQGTLLRAPIALPGVYAPENHEVLSGQANANLPGSGGFEGMALNASGTQLYTLLEKTVAGDPAKTLRMDQFDLVNEAYTGVRFHYVLEAAGTNIGDMVAVDDQRFIVIERNGATNTGGGTPFKKLFMVDLNGVAPGGTVQKTELVDLMNLADPHDLNGDGSQVFTLPYVTIENVTVIDDRTLLVANDNNFPYGGGRALAADDTEFLRIKLPVSLSGR
ncbi:esterase-like activity of phytase family protein [Ideonella sp. 4Y11]|uniref:Esterase-like activity of phytase family protein n=1 Tax=Ideonella aquatica TaxID=2824119 RepID=A0A941BIL1_9BURK|nr:esterase-like activity of phytase family protein [Ideonella aquatica]MBQ0957943.1 esterase-like activity of phytase family protein [Ideonella aquatica]